MGSHEVPRHPLGFPRDGSWVPSGYLGFARESMGITGGSTGSARSPTGYHQILREVYPSREKPRKAEGLPWGSRGRSLELPRARGISPVFPRHPGETQETSRGSPRVFRTFPWYPVWYPGGKREAPRGNTMRPLGSPLELPRVLALRPRGISRFPAGSRVCPPEVFRVSLIEVSRFSLIYRSSSRDPPREYVGICGIP